MFAQIFLIALLIFASLQTAAASDGESNHPEIDRTVWQPFKSAFERLDGNALNVLYADSVLRVTPAGIDTDGNFKVINTSRFNDNIKRGDRISLDFWFDSRRTNATTSYDVGFYRVITTASSGNTSTFYGQFHIVLQKIEGRWRITQDWDTSSIAGRTISAADFAQKTPIEF